MSLILDDNAATYQIRAYRPGQIQINDQLFEQSVIISPEKLISPWAPQCLNELKREDLEAVIDLHPTILLIGTGHILQFPDIKLYGDLMNKNIGVEIMNTHAACRTYTILSAEGRSVVAAILIK